MAALDNIASELLKAANVADLNFKKTRDQAERDKAVRLRRIVENLKAISAGGLTPTLDQVLTQGNTSTNTLNVGGITTDYVQLDTAATPTLAPGMFAWNDAFGTADLRLKGNNVTLQLGQETLARVVNKTGSDLLESQYKVVRVRVASEGGAQGQRLAVVLAQGLNDPESATTLGIVTENIANNQEGFITVFGNVNNINTTGSLQGETWVDGDVLYLSPTTAGGLTKVKPTAPQHMVIIGYVVYAHANNGKIFVKVDNGYELDELHNVRITSVANNDLLQYDSTLQVWKNVAASVAVPTPTLAQVTTAGNTTTNNITIGTLFFGNGNHYLVTDNESYAMLSSNRTLQLATSGNPVLSVFTSQNVAIGTTTDAGYKLDVNGTIRSSGTNGLVLYDGTYGAKVSMSSYLFLIEKEGSYGVSTYQFKYSDNSNALYLSGLTSIVGIGGGDDAVMMSRNVYARHDAAFGFTTYGGTTKYKAIQAIYTDNNTSGVAFNYKTGGTDTEAMRITSTGNVGIGTSNPLYKLHVTDSAGDIVYILASTGQSAIIGATGSGTNRMYIGYSPGAENISITSSGVVRLNSITSGNVLIGTTTDAGYKLDINGIARVGDSGGSGQLYIKGFAGTGQYLYLDDGSKVWSLVGSTNYSIQENGTSRLIVKEGGNVGIGTTNPTDKFHIVDNTNGNKFGRISAGGTDASAAWVAQNDQVDNVVYRVFGSAVTGTQMGISLARSASLMANLGGTGKFLIGSFSGTDLIFGTSDQARMRLVDATGNFLIGTMTDNGNRLTVSGNIDAQAYKVNNVLGYTGILNIPTNPPGQQNIDIQGGIVINIF